MEWCVTLGTYLHVQVEDRPDGKGERLPCASAATIDTWALCAYVYIPHDGHCEDRYLCTEYGVLYGI